MTVEVKFITRFFIVIGSHNIGLGVTIEQHLCYNSDMSTKRTYQPSKIKRVRKVGFRARQATAKGRLVMKRRRLKGRSRVVLS